MDLKQTIIAALADDAVEALAQRTVGPASSATAQDLRALLQHSPDVTLDATLSVLRKDALATICDVLGLDTQGRRDVLASRLRTFAQQTSADVRTAAPQDETREAKMTKAKNSKEPAKKVKVAQENWYDYPEYWEMAFADETKPEADFIEAACKKYAIGPVQRLMEPGCGSGRLVMEMTKRGYHMTGFDLNVPSLDFLRGRLAKRGWNADVFTGDMADFTVAQPVDAAFNTFSTFRHLLTEEQAEGHFRSMLNALRPGGLYLLGLHLIPPGTDDTCTERWRATRGKTEVVYTFRVTGNNRKERKEHIRVNMLVKKPAKQFRLVTEFDLRLYSSRQFKSLLEKFPEFELCDVFDYNFELEHPFRLDSTMSDTMLVLRKR
ncbi:MAG: class I SAM-dependent methyltransferase [Pirellulales bacterium]